jgi:hypothetical protein
MGKKDDESHGNSKGNNAGFSDFPRPGTVIAINGM